MIGRHGHLLGHRQREDGRLVGDGCWRGHGWLVVDRRRSARVGSRSWSTPHEEAHSLMSKHRFNVPGDCLGQECQRSQDRGDEMDDRCSLERS